MLREESVNLGQGTALGVQTSARKGWDEGRRGMREKMRVASVMLFDAAEVTRQNVQAARKVTPAERSKISCARNNEALCHSGICNSMGYSVEGVKLISSVLAALMVAQYQSADLRASQLKRTTRRGGELITREESDLITQEEAKSATQKQGASPSHTTVSRVIHRGRKRVGHTKASRVGHTGGRGIGYTRERRVDRTRLKKSTTQEQEESVSP